MGGTLGLSQRGLGGGSSPVVMYGNGGPCGVAPVGGWMRAVSWRIVAVSVSAVVT